MRNEREGKNYTFDSMDTEEFEKEKHCYSLSIAMLLFFHIFRTFIFLILVTIEDISIKNIPFISYTTDKP